MKKILIVDDAPFVREVLQNLLTKQGYEVIGEAANGAEAIQLASALRPDLILMDIIMPETSGIEAARSIQQTHPEIPIVAMSTEESAHIVAQAIEAGCVDYVVKPFRKDDLFTTIEKVFLGNTMEGVNV